MKYMFIALCFFLFNNSYGAKVDTIDVYSAAMNKSVRCVVIRPDFIKSKEKLSALYLLHGYSGNYKSWVNDFPTVKPAVDQYNFMVVCPDGGYSSWFFDSPIDSTFRYERLSQKNWSNALTSNIQL